MRKIELTTQFKKDHKRVRAGQRGGELDERLNEALRYLAVDEPLPARWRDHQLTGNWVDHRECHLKGDLLLIYQKPTPETLILVRLGSHSDLLE